MHGGRGTRATTCVPRSKMAAQRAVSGRKVCCRGNMLPRTGLSESPLPSRWRACGPRAGANKSLSNCSLKKLTAVAPSRWRPTKGPALKPRLGVVYFVGRVLRVRRCVTALFIDIYNQRDTRDASGPLDVALLLKG